jgi:hypothetical protein
VAGFILVTAQEPILRVLFSHRFFFGAMASNEGAPFTSSGDW